MVLQSYYLAAAVRVRHVVRAWGRQNTCAAHPLSRGAGAGSWLSRLCLLDRDDVACAELGAFRAILARPRHVFHRQDQSRPVAPDPLSRHGGPGRPLHTPCLGGAHRSLVATTHPLRPAFASNLRLRYLLVIPRSYHPGRNLQYGIRSDPRKCSGHNPVCRPCLAYDLVPEEGRVAISATNLGERRSSRSDAKLIWSGS